MSLPSYQRAMVGFTTEGLTSSEALKKRVSKWNWAIGATLIGPHLDCNGLAACCRLSKEFHNLFTPILWSNPTTVVKGTEKPVQKLYIFMFLAHTAPITSRSLVQKLDFNQILSFKKGPPAERALERRMFDAMYNGPWLMNCTKLFPNLRFAIMDELVNLNFNPIELADHHDPLTFFAAQALARQDSNDPLLKFAPVCYEVQKPRAKLVQTKPVLFSVNGLNRSVLLNHISTSHLLYLDISYTKRDSMFCEFYLANLRVLKMRGCRLVDVELQKWVSTDCKLWCLDVRDNLLTDEMAHYINLKLVLNRIPRPKQPTGELADRDLYEDVPEYQRNEDREMASKIAPRRPSEQDGFISYIDKYAHFPSLNDQLLDANDPLLRRTGLTHLYISDNKLTSHGVKLLLTGTNRLQHLDVGSVESNHPDNPRKLYIPYTTAYAQLNSKCNLGLLRESGSRMETLRIHHSVVTFVPTILNFGSRTNGFSLELVKRAEDMGRVMRLAHRIKEPKQLAFSPLHNYRVTTLTLTDIPMKSYGFTITRLIDFLNACATQERTLNEARKLQTSRRAPQLLPGLRILNLEFLPEDTSAQSPGGGSVSGDRDADNFLASSEGDFSFFADPNTMSSVSRRGSVATISESGTVTAPTTPASRKASLAGTAALQKQLSGLSISSRPGSPGWVPLPPLYSEVLNVVDELKKFRAANVGQWSGMLKISFVKRPE